MFRLLSLPTVLKFATAAVVALAVTTAGAREWTYDHGVTFRADFVRLVNGMAVLRQDGKTLTIDLSELSKKDQSWARSASTCSKRRDWKTYDNQVIRGKLVKLDLGDVTIRTRDGNKTIPLVNLSEEDRRLITTFHEVPMVEGKRPQPKAETPEAAGTSAKPVGGYRVWTSKTGKRVAAEYRGKVGDVVVLYGNEREYRVPLARLSPEDRKYVEAMVAAENNIDFDELDPEDETVEAPGDAIVADAEAHGNELHRAAVDRLQDLLKKWEKLGGDPPASIRIQTVNGRQRVWADGVEVFGEKAQNVVALYELREAERKEQEEVAAAEREKRRKQFQEEALEAQRKRAEHAREMAEKRKAMLAAQAAAAPPPKAPTTYTHTCSACEKTFETNHELRLGDTCPHCSTRFDVLADEDGNVLEESTQISARRYGRAIKLAIFGVLTLGGFLGWLVKRG